MGVALACDEINADPEKLKQIAIANANKVSIHSIMSESNSK